MPSAEYWPFVLYAALVAVAAAGIIGVSALLGQRHKRDARIAMTRITPPDEA